MQVLSKNCAQLPEKKSNLIGLKKLPLKQWTQAIR